AAARHVKNFAVVPVGTQQRGNHADVFLIAAAQNDCAGTIAEKHAGAAVGPVDDRGELFGADNQSMLKVSGAEHRLADVEDVEKTGAGCLDIERRNSPQIELCLQQTGG